MNKKSKILFLICAFGVFTSCTGMHKKHKHLKNEVQLRSIVNSERRSEENRIRNVYRHPVETLMFFGVEPNMKVVEVSPGGGWYTEILGPYLRKEGELFLSVFSENSDRSYAPKLLEKIKTLTSDKERFGKVNFTTLDTPKFIEDVAPDSSVDRVLVFRNIHSWMGDEKLKEVLAKFYKALKPGGVLGIVQHRANTNYRQDSKAKKGYVREDYVIDRVLEAGFEFVAKSEVNANYNDQANYKDGVWTLPPSLRLKEKDRSKYLAIGESDRMTLKFKKPIQ